MWSAICKPAETSADVTCKNVGAAPPLVGGKLGFEVGIVRVRCIKSARFRLRAYIYAREPVNLVGFNEPILDPV